MLVLEHMGFPVEPQLEHCQYCEAILTVDKWQLLPRAQHPPPQDVPEDIAVNHPTKDIDEPYIAPSAAPAVTAPLPTSSASSAPPSHTASVGPSTSAPPPQYTSISTRDFLTIMDVVCTFSATSASFVDSHTTLDEMMTHTETVIAQNHIILVQIQSHLGLPPISPSVPAQASLDHSPVAPAAATHQTPSTASLNILTTTVADSPPTSSAAAQLAQAEDDIPPAAHY